MPLPSGGLTSQIPHLNSLYFRVMILKTKGDKYSVLEDNNFQ